VSALDSSPLESDQPWESRRYARSWTMVDRIGANSDNQLYY